MRIIIPGPPGTGKTHHLINYYLVKEIEEYKTHPSKIAYLTFSKAATEEARKRIEPLFPKFDFKKDFINVSTMHGLGTRELNIDTSAQLLQGRNWNQFKNFSQICDHMNFDSTVGEEGFVQHKNMYMKIIEYARSTRVNLKIEDLEEVAIELDLINDPNLDISTLEQIYTDLEFFKKSYYMFEFSDMIKQFIEKDKCPSLDAVFLDEAQDLNPLQWDMFKYIESRCKRSYIAGDDDQTIYAFQGANPDSFINLQGTYDPQIISRRVPRKIHQLATSIFPHMSYRLEKKWEPRDAEGEITRDKYLEEIDLSKGNWMILVRTNKMLSPIVEHLESLNYRFDCKLNYLLPIKLVEAIKIWERLNKGASVSKEEAKLLYGFLRYNKGDLKYGFSEGKTLEKIDSVDMDDLREHHGLLVKGDWQVLSMSDEQKQFIKNLLDQGEDLFKPARIKVSTIHGVKGEESDNVILFTDLTQFIYESVEKNPDPEHRLFFVGITRTKNHLYLVPPTSEYIYNIGESI